MGAGNGGGRRRAAGQRRPLRRGRPARRRADRLSHGRSVRRGGAAGRGPAGRASTPRPTCRHAMRSGYQHPDLTAHDSQVQDWYDTEAGLDLRVLDDDTRRASGCGQRDRGGAVAAACAGHRARGGLDRVGGRLRDAVSAAPLRRRSRGGRAMSAPRPRAMQRCVTTCGRWSTTRSRRPSPSMIAGWAERSAWLAAAHAVTAGAGDRSAAEELIRRQVNPYVDNDIRADWLTAMRSTAASVAASYDAAIEALSLGTRCVLRGSRRAGAELATGNR